MLVETHTEYTIVTVGIIIWYVREGYLFFIYNMIIIMFFNYESRWYIKMYVRMSLVARMKTLKSWCDPVLWVYAYLIWILVNGFLLNMECSLRPVEIHPEYTVRSFGVRIWSVRDGYPFFIYKIIFIILCMFKSRWYIKMSVRMSMLTWMRKRNPWFGFVFSLWAYFISFLVNGLFHYVTINSTYRF